MRSDRSRGKELEHSAARDSGAPSAILVTLLRHFSQAVISDVLYFLYVVSKNSTARRRVYVIIRVVHDLNHTRSILINQN